MDPAAVLSEVRRSYERAADLLVGLAGEGYRSSYWYLVEVFHGLGRDAAAAKLFLRQRESSPDDPILLDALAYVCHEYVGDHNCAYDAQMTLLRLRAVPSAADSTEVAEVALTVRNFDLAKDILVRSAPSDTSACGRSVGNFLLTWANLGQARLDRARKAYDSWRSELMAHREARVGGCWLFHGDRAYLSNSDSLSEKGVARVNRERAELVRTFLLAMIDAMERNTPIPDFPVQLLEAQG